MNSATRAAPTVVASLLAAALACNTLAQLSPERLYYGVHQPINIRVTTPDNIEIDTVIMLQKPDGTTIKVAGVVPGVANLATMFPEIWTSPIDGVWYAQLHVGIADIGAPIVIQPLKGSGPAQMTDEAGSIALKLDEKTRQPNFGTRNARISYPQPDKLLTGVRVYVDRVATMQTSLGDIEFAMRPDAAPNTVFNFLHLAEGGFYTGVIFHRVVAKLPSGHAFVIQTGDPTGTGDGGPGYAIDLEPSTLPHDFGVLSMARDDDPNTNGSQIFVALSREGTARLDGRYTAFAQALSGAEVIRTIAAVKVGENDRPLDPPVIKAIKLDPAPPLSRRRPLTPEVKTTKPETKPSAAPGEKPPGEKPPGEKK